MDRFILHEKYISIIYKKIHQQIPSTNEIASWSPERRPDGEIRLIFSVISRYIHTDRKGAEIVTYLINPKNNEPGILLKMVK